MQSCEHCKQSWPCNTTLGTGHLFFSNFHTTLFNTLYIDAYTLSPLTRDDIDWIFIFIFFKDKLCDAVRNVDVWMCMDM